MSTYPTACYECERDFEEKPVTDKQHKVLERTIEAFLVTLTLALVSALLLGVYALASLVL